MIRQNGRNGCKRRTPQPLLAFKINRSIVDSISLGEGTEEGKKNRTNLAANDPQARKQTHAKSPKPLTFLASLTFSLSLSRCDLLLRCLSLSFSLSLSSLCLLLLLWRLEECLLSLEMGEREKTLRSTAEFGKNRLFSKNASCVS